MESEDLLVRKWSTGQFSVGGHASEVGFGFPTQNESRQMRIKRSCCFVPVRQS